MARELAGVYVSLRERYPAVAPGRVDFASRRLGPLLGQATLPDPLPTSVIELSACLGHPRCLGHIRQRWAHEATRSSAPAAPARVAPTRLSEAALVLVHEFGHLVDHHVDRLGRTAAERVYGALSLAAFPDRLQRSPRPDRWTAYLFNYPTADRMAMPGRQAGGPARAAIIRAALNEELSAAFGRYATTSREELFAEAFAAMYGTPDRQLARGLTRLRRALEDVGVARRRRR
jgi:hypothetical protein